MDTSITPTNLDNSVQFADDAVVSKVLLKKQSGTITLFAFDEGQELSEHTAPYDALVHMLDGTANWRIGNQNVTVQAGEYIVLPANVPHAVVATTPFKMLLIMIRT